MNSNLISASVNSKQQKKELRRQRNEPPSRSVLEEIGNAVTHGIGALLSIAGTVLLLVKADTRTKYVAASIYGACLILMFLMSCLYHSFRRGTRVKRLWRRFDYSSIYLLIGGTFTPIWLLHVGGRLGLLLCCAQWLIILVGITFVAIFGPGSLRAMHQALFITLGWSALFLLPSLFRNARGLFITTLAGGVFYTLGIIPFAIKTRGSHFLWHFFVMAGAAAQWVGIYCFLY